MRTWHVVIGGTTAALLAATLSAAAAAGVATAEGHQGVQKPGAPPRSSESARRPQEKNPVASALPAGMEASKAPKDSSNDTLESVTILALSPSENRVALGMPDGTIKVARPGDVILDGVTLKAVHGDKLSVDLPSKRNDGSKDIGWMFRSVPAGRGSRIQRFDPVPPPVPSVPVVVSGAGGELKSSPQAARP